MPDPDIFFYHLTMHRGTSFEDAAGGSGSSSGNSSYGRSEGQGGGGSVGIGVIGSEKRTDGWTSGDSSALRGDGVHEVMKYFCMLVMLRFRRVHRVDSLPRCNGVHPLNVCSLPAEK